MKKIYTLIAAAFVAFGANAQGYDLSISWSALTDGETVTETEFEGGIIITNEGGTLSTGDTLCFGYRIDGSFFTLGFAGGYNYIVLEADMATGETMSFDNGVVVTPPLEAEFCAVIHGIGAASFGTFEGDTNPDDNITCVSINVEEIDDSGIEDLALALGNVYVAGGQLMIVNEGVTVENQANLKIININGQTVQTENLTLSQGTSAVEINNLSAGIYIVAIEVEGAMLTRKISIQ